MKQFQRKIDELGRVIIPEEIRQQLGIKAKNRVGIMLVRSEIVIVSNLMVCNICGRPVETGEKSNLCNECIRKVIDGVGEIQAKRIVPLGNESAIFIDFGDNRIKEYDTSDLEMLDLGYASTIHKSQGSEYKSVIINLQCAHSIMLTRPLIYTAITRGKDKVTIVGERRAMCIAIKRTDTEKRGTCLAHRLQELDINERM